MSNKSLAVLIVLVLIIFGLIIRSIFDHHPGKVYFFVILFLSSMVMIWVTRDEEFKSLNQQKFKSANDGEQLIESDSLMNSYKEWKKGKEKIERREEEIMQIINYITDENIKSIELDVYNNEIIHLTKHMYQEGLKKGNDPDDIIDDIDQFIAWNGSNGVDAADMEDLLMILRSTLDQNDISEVEYEIEDEKVRRPSISQSVKDKVWNRDGGKCVQCGSNENIEFDHIIPFSKGGSSTYRNLQILCENCNRSKSDKIG